MIPRNDARREQIREMLSTGRTLYSIAKELGIRHQTVMYYRDRIHEDTLHSPETIQNTKDADILHVAFEEGRNSSLTWTPEEEAAYDRLKSKGVVE